MLVILIHGLLESTEINTREKLWYWVNMSINSLIHIHPTCGPAKTTLNAVALVLFYLSQKLHGFQTHYLFVCKMFLSLVLFLVT